MTTLLVGQAPTRSMSEDDPPFRGTRTGRSLAQLCGQDDPRWLERSFDLVNIIDNYPGPDPLDPGKDDFPRVPALLGAGITRELVMEGSWDRVITLGPMVPLLLWGRRQPWLTWTFMSRGCDLLRGPQMFEVAASPFPPVGPDPWWDIRGNRNQGTEFWRAVAGYVRAER